MKKFLTIIFGVLFSIPAFATLPQAAINAGYTQVEYIQSSGTQYIDTGIVGTINTDIEIKGADFTGQSAQLVVTTTNGSQLRIAKFTATQKVGAGIGTGAPTYSTSDGVSQFVAKLENHNLYLDGQLVGAVSTDGFNQGDMGHMLIFAGQYGNTTYYGKGKIYYVKIWDNNTLVADYVPVRRVSDGVIGMYNVLDSNPETAFYGNAGTGEFTGGPEVCPNGGTLQTYTTVASTDVPAGVQDGTPTPTNPITPTFYTQGNMVLRKVGNIADSYDASTGVITRRIGIRTFNGSEDWNAYVSVPERGYYIGGGAGIPVKLGVSMENQGILSSHFKYYKWTNNTEPMPTNSIGLNINASSGNVTNGNMTIKPDMTAFPTVESWKTWLSSHPITVYYQLPEETTEDWAAEQCSSPIKIATRAYNTTQFAPVVSALNTAIDTIKDVVTNTINQTAAVSALQSTKQTRPNDACPQYKQCLLVETEDGTPQWFVITDPFRDLFSPVIANNIAATGTTSQNAYTQLQYIYMTEGSYIKVEDLPISAGYRVEFDFQTTSLSSPLRNYIGGRASGVSAGGGFRLSKLASSNNTRVVLYGFESGTEYYDPTAQFQANTRYKYTYNNGVCTLESGGSVVSTQTFTVTDNTSTNWGINTYTGGTTWQTDSDGIYVYSLKVWNTQGALVMNLVPAIQGTTIGFFDTVTGDLREPSAGTFTAGPTVSNQNATWTATFSANDTYGYGRSIVYGTAKCNATSGSANNVATSTQMSANNWTATGSNCWCYAERVNETSSGVSGTSANRWVYLAVPSGETCAANCVENCADAVGSGAAADKPFRQALVGL